jgi:curved DNA-binding protein CbpA
MPDHYQTLGVSRNADAKTIKQQYRKLAREHHPDRGGNAETFKEINAAYEVLGDAQRRRQYDLSFQQMPIFSPVPTSAPIFTRSSVMTTVEINGFTKTVTTIETKNGVTTTEFKTSNVFSFW